jgi:methionyl-tRNA formyltransferase
MRVVFLGSPDAALPSLRALLDTGHVVPLIVTQPDRPAGRGRRLLPCPVKIFALERGIPVVQPEKLRKDPDIAERLRSAEAEIHVVVAYGQLIPRVLIDLPRHSTINVHFSLLPRFRGASPVAAAILAGETRTGVTIFRLNEKMDEGDILTTAGVDIHPTETAGDLEDRLAESGARLLVRTLAEIADLPLRPQDHSQATLAPKLRKEDGRLDWSRTADELDRRVRAMTPWPSAFSFHRGRRLIITSGRPEADFRPTVDSSPAPGTVLETSKGGILVAGGANTRYRLLRLQPESRPPMEAQAYVLGGKIAVGDILD